MNFFLCIKALLLICSLCGYSFYIHRKGIEMAFAPALVISGVGICMLFAGLLNVMPHVVSLIFIGGLVLFAYNIYKNVCNKEKIAVDYASLIFFCLLAVLLALRLQTARATAFDNFSHWLLVVRDMLRSNQLPNFMSELIIYQSYPTGTAGVIYFVAKVVGEAEWVLLWGQSLILASCLCVFFAFVKKVNGYAIGAICLFSLYLLAGNILISELLVDSVLSFVGVAAFAAIYYYWDRLDRAALCAGVLGAFLVLVKNSGVFFVLIHGLLICILWVADCIRKKRLPSAKEVCTLGGLAGVLPLGILYLWKRHVYYAFNGGNMGAHSMSVENYTVELGHKSAEQIIQVLRIFLNRIVSPGPELLVLMMVAVTLLVCFGAAKRSGHAKAGNALRLLIWSIFVYAAYLAGLAAMYIFSMGLDESLVLASYDRYLMTIVLYLAAVPFIYLLEIGSRERPLAYIAAGILSVLLLLGTWENVHKTIIETVDFKTTPRGKLERICEEYDLPWGERFYIIGKNRSGLLGNIARIAFWEAEVPCGIPSEEDAEMLLESYDCIIDLLRNEDSQKVIAAMGLPAGQEVYILGDDR